jgi:lysyl-tRNA synthetase class 2
MSGTGNAWRPTASQDTLRRRATALVAVRKFFASRGLLEVETPLIVSHPVSDPQLANVRCELAVCPGVPLFLHTSPEYHMKRLLASGSPDIFQICKAFRDGELGPRHLPEFTLIEWYRRGVDYDEFIAESCALVRTVGASIGRQIPPPVRRSYSDAFVAAAGIEPLTASIGAIRGAASTLLPGRVDNDLAQALGDDRSGWLDLLMVSVVEPSLRSEGLIVLERYPAEQAALARLEPADPRVARRFELYLDGLELANGYHELADAREQRLRFEADRRRRLASGKPDAPPDGALLAALTAGLPDCCGIALGFDRLLMACLGLADISEAVAFTTPERA